MEGGILLLKFSVVVFSFPLLEIFSTPLMMFIAKMCLNIKIVFVDLFVVYNSLSK